MYNVGTLYTFKLKIMRLWYYSGITIRHGSESNKTYIYRSILSDLNRIKVFCLFARDYKNETVFPYIIENFS